MENEKVPLIACVNEEQVCQRLFFMRDRDQDMRRGEWDVEVDHQNVAELKTWLDSLDWDWPTVCALGDEAVHAVWLMTQHAVFDRPFQERLLPLLKLTHMKWYAYLYDRLEYMAGREQRYGTQISQRPDGTWYPKRCEEGYDERRVAVGLKPFQEHMRDVGR